MTFKYERRERERSSKSSWDDRMEEKKSADYRRQERAELERQQLEKQIATERLAEKEKHQNQQAKAVQLKDELINQVAKLK